LRENENNGRILQNRQNMFISIAAASMIWTEGKTSFSAFQLPAQADSENSEILTIKHPSSPDKLVKIPLKSVNYIDLVIGRENHWVYRAVKEQQTSLQPYELEDLHVHVCYISRQNAIP
jgi:hypothetical protein